MALPRTLKKFNMFIDGESYLGRAESVTLPKLSRKMEEFRGGGMDAPIEIDLGQEKMEVEITLREYSRAVLAQWGICDAAGVSLRFRGAAARDDANCDVDAVEVVMRGRFREIDFGTVKEGELSEMKLAGSLSYYKYIINGETLIEIDILNMICIVNGVDRLAKARNALGV